MNRTEILTEAARLVSSDREAQHGDPRENFRRVALAWSAVSGYPITPAQVPLMMAALKGVRAAMGNTNPDDFVDGAGYFALAGESRDGIN